VSTSERALVLPLDLLSRLSRAVEASDPEAALREALGRCAIAKATSEQIVTQALLVGRRAREREPRASLCELELSLGVLLVLHGVVPCGASEVAP
jgi:hypothetical protein